MKAIETEARARTVHMLEGVIDYQQCETHSTRTEHRVIWRQGNANLLDFWPDAPSDTPAVFCIPSLINKYHILDLYPERSLVWYLLEQGIRPLILDWNEPGLREKHYDCADYVYYLLEEAIRAARFKLPGPFHLLGYCMGGLFALACALRSRHPVDGLILLATPWHFQPNELLGDEEWQHFADRISEQDTLPALWTQTLFHMLDPWHFQQKFARFPTMSEVEKQHFVQVEEWVNDGIPLAKRVALECFVEWPRHNPLAAGAWQIHGEAVNPSAITCPTFIAMPREDRIVPLHSSQPLADAIPHAEVIYPPTGHVSMIVGSKAKVSLWQPLAEWIHACGAA